MIRRCVRRANRITFVKFFSSAETVQIPVADLLKAQDERVDKRVGEAIQRMIDVHEKSEERTREELKEIKMAIKESRIEADRNVERLRIETRENVERLRVETRENVERLRVETQENVERLRVDLKGSIDSSHWKVMFGLGTVIVGLPSVAYAVYELMKAVRGT